MGIGKRPAAEKKIEKAATIQEEGVLNSAASSQDQSAAYQTLGTYSKFVSANMQNRTQSSPEKALS
jgi:hypothetical protein